MKHHPLLLAILLAAVVCGCTTAQALPKKSSLPEFTVIGKDCYAAPIVNSAVAAGKSGYYVTIIIDGYPRETRVGADARVREVEAPCSTCDIPKCYLEAKVGEVLRSECR